ncbi:MAG: cytochrome c oxidase assembly factor Coa1 family protein [Candidatus Acidiferrales bacterium]
MTSAPPSMLGTPPPPRPRSWLARHWVALVIVCVFVVFPALIGSLFYGIESMMRASYAYQLAVKRASESPAVAVALGAPLRIGWLVSGNVNFNGATEDASLSIPISGPKGAGHIVVVGKKRGNRWNFETLEVDVGGQEEPIPLLEATPATPDEPAANST